MEVKLIRTTRFTGRNGYFKMTAIDLGQFWYDRVIRISPVTTQGLVGRCNMEVPIEDVDAFCAALQKSKKDIEKNIEKEVGQLFKHT